MHWFRLLLAACAWATAAALGLAFAADTSIGPVVVVLSPTHGIHLGDVMGCIGAAAIALVVSLLLLLPASQDAPSQG